MSVVTYAVKPILFGIPSPIPNLPPGFSLVTDPKDWLLAKSDDGKTWFVGDDTLTQRTIATKEDADAALNRISIGQPFFDEREQIKFNPETGEVIS